MEDAEQKYLIGGLVYALQTNNKAKAHDYFRACVRHDCFKIFAKTLSREKEDVLTKSMLHDDFVMFKNLTEAFYQDGSKDDTVIFLMECAVSLSLVQYLAFLLDYFKHSGPFELKEIVPYNDLINENTLRVYQLLICHGVVVLNESEYNPLDIFVKLQRLDILETVVLPESKMSYDLIRDSFIHACQLGHLAVVEVLLKSPAITVDSLEEGISETSEVSNELLKFFISKGHQVKDYSKMEIDVIFGNTKDFSWKLSDKVLLERLFHRCVVAGNVSGIEKLVDENSDILSPQIFHKGLLAAVRCNLLYMTDRLLQHAEVNEYSSDGIGNIETALQIACFNGQIEMARLLLESGADPNDIPPHSTESAFHLACMLKPECPELVSLLLDHGADVNAICNVSEELSALHHACSKLSAETVKILLDNNASLYYEDTGNHSGFCKVFGNCENYLEIDKLEQYCNICSLKSGARIKVLSEMINRRDQALDYDTGSIIHHCLDSTYEAKDVAVLDYLLSSASRRAVKSWLLEMHMAEEREAWQKQSGMALCTPWVQMTVLMAKRVQAFGEEDLGNFWSNVPVSGWYDTNIYSLTVFMTAVMGSKCHHRWYVGRTDLLLTILIYFSWDVVKNGDLFNVKAALKCGLNLSQYGCGKRANKYLNTEMAKFDSALCDLFTTPQSLQDLCRITIRRRIGKQNSRTSMESAIRTLPGPETVRKFLLFGELV